MNYADRIRRRDNRPQRPKEDATPFVWCVVTIGAVCAVGQGMAL